MKNILFLCVISSIIIISGCDMSHNFMDIDNPNAKNDLQYYIGSGNIPKINAENIIPDSLSGVRKDAKGYANQYIEDNLQEYVDIAKNSLSGTKEAIKGYYNEGVDELNGIISNKVNGAISGELSKFKIK